MTETGENSRYKANYELKKYTFTTKQIPRFSPGDSRINEMITGGMPLIIRNHPLVKPAKKWTLDYLEEHIGNGNFNVYESRSNIFKYFDEKKVEKTFETPMVQREMTFSDFKRKLQSWKPEEPRLYLQQGLNDTVGQQIVMDFLQFDWNWAKGQQERNGWGSLTSNLLLIGQEGNVTPCHYDEQENFFNQVHGYKRVILFAPEQFENLYPYPVYHPHDRQCQVDFENPNFVQFPKFHEARGLEAVLEPGDMLYLPMYWFHHFESLMVGGPTVSITFWYKAAPTLKVEYPLKGHQKMAMMRNIEKMITEALGDQQEVAPFLQNMVLGRYT